MFTETTGDLFALDVDAIGHGCCMRGVMGAGIAKEFSSRWPEMFYAYKALCRSGDFSLGSYMRYEVPVDPQTSPRLEFVYNLCTQVASGADARLDAIDAAVRSALVDAAERRIWSLALPQIGCGIGGLQWPDVRTVLAAAADGSPVELIAVTYEDPA
jgi:O-acetyl-ADP-ribose deacetylase (regulator of RNase III)